MQDPVDDVAAEQERLNNIALGITKPDDEDKEEKKIIKHARLRSISHVSQDLLKEQPRVFSQCPQAAAATIREYSMKANLAFDVTLNYESRQLCHNHMTKKLCIVSYYFLHFTLTLN